MNLLVVDVSQFIGQFLDGFANVLYQYIIILQNIVLFKVDTYEISAFDLRLGVLFLQLFFGIYLVVGPCLGSGSVLKGNGI